MPHVTGQGSALLLAACFTFGLRGDLRDARLGPRP